MTPLEIADQRVLEARDRERDRWLLALRSEQSLWLLRRGLHGGQLEALHLLAKRVGVLSIEGLDEAIDHSRRIERARRRFLLPVLLTLAVGAIMFGGAWQMGRTQPFGRKDCVCFNVETAP